MILNGDHQLFQTNPIYILCTSCLSFFSLTESYNIVQFKIRYGCVATSKREDPLQSLQSSQYTPQIIELIKKNVDFDKDRIDEIYDIRLRTQHYNTYNKSTHGMNEFIFASIESDYMARPNLHVKEPNLNTSMRAYKRYGMK